MFFIFKLQRLLVPKIHQDLVTIAKCFQNIVITKLQTKTLQSQRLESLKVIFLSMKLERI
jgi:hypothetical protein